MLRLVLLSVAALVLLFLTPACTGDGAGAKGESRISGRAGIAVGSAQFAPPIGRRPGGETPAP